MSIFVTGDTHGDFHSFSKLHKKEQYNDITHLIIAGDYGNYFYPKRTKEELYWEKVLSQKPYEILFVDGNHENFEIINSFPVEERYGGKVHKCFKNIYHLMRGEIYTINGIRIFVFGGGASIDKNSRTPGISWWPEEIPNYSEYKNGLKNLEKYNYEVDYVITHSCPKSIFDEFKRKFYMLEKEVDEERQLREYLQNVYEKAIFKKWYCGHFHLNINVKNVVLLYEHILCLGDSIKSEDKSLDNPQIQNVLW